MDKKIYLFSKSNERIFLIFQYILIILFLLSLLNTNYNSFFSSNIANLILGYIFLNTLHTFFIFVLILFLPEFRRALVQKLKTKWFFFFTFFSTIGMAGSVISNFQINSIPNIMFISVITFGILESTHNISQTKGISLLFNKKIKENINNNIELTKFGVVETTERKLFLLLILTQIFGFCFKAFGSNITNFKNILYFYLFLTISVASLIFLNSFRYPKVINSNKRQYLTIIFLGALTPIHAPASWLFKALHGIEYMLLIKLFFKNSIFKINFSKIILIFIILSLFLVLTLLSHGYLDFSKFKIINNYWPFILIFSYLRQYFHFYLDSQVFKFNDPIIKKELKNII